jgi:hypothetical protein
MYLCSRRAFRIIRKVEKMMDFPKQVDATRSGQSEKIKKEIFNYKLLERRALAVCGLGNQVLIFMFVNKLDKI